MAGQKRRQHGVSSYISYAVPLGFLIFGWLFLDWLIYSINGGVSSVAPRHLDRLDQPDEIVSLIDVDQINVTRRDQSCTFWRCFNPYRCNYYGDYRLTVYIYSWRRYISSNGGRELTPAASGEFVELLDAVRRSPYFEPDPNKACIFLPSIDTLNEDRLDLDGVSSALSSLKWWNDGQNHLLFNMLPGHFPLFNSSLGVHTGQAMIAGGGYGSQTYRRTFDISLSVYHPSQKGELIVINRTWLLISTMPFPKTSDALILRNLEKNHPDELLFLASCATKSFDPSRRCQHGKKKNASMTSHSGKSFGYPKVLQAAKYCLVLEGNRLGQVELSDALQFGCVPIVFVDDYVLPFSEVLDWKRVAVIIYRHQLPQIVEILKRDIDSARYQSMVSQGAWFWKAYFSSLESIALTTLRILQDRAFPHQSRSYSEWNDNKQALFPFQPFPSHRTAPNDGFTAVILTYDRTSTLFQQIYQLSRVQSLAKIIVVWNNQHKAPPPSHEWPKISKPIKVIRTLENRLTNRFVPYNEIETEAVLSLDDDILMLNSDELEFGYQAWREFPSCLVGYPSRVHFFDAANQRWTYESEWTNNASLILTGAAFYHNYYNLLFTESMPQRVKNWIDNLMNCEDIAMNFLIANSTGQPALKVTPRKKFKPNASTGQALSADSDHLKQRSDCLNQLSRYFGGLILKTVEFRLDPLLYKIDLPDDLKLYPDVGPL